MVQQKKWGVILAAIFILSVFTCLYIGRSLVWGLTLTLALAVGILKSNGIPFKTSMRWIKEGILSIKDIYIIVFF